jgi:3'(2'), 5'-bisphosphate nucleotidase
MIIDNELIELLTLTAKEAGKEIMDIFNSDFKIRSKPDNTPVTVADEEAEALIRATLLKHYPTIPFVGEESYKGENDQTSKWDTFWLVDALDGTKEFVANRKDFTVNIALIHKKKPVAGVVYAPAQNLLYTGYATEAYMQKNENKKHKIHTRPAKKSGLTLVKSRSHRSNDYKHLNNLRIKETVILGSSLKFCMVASGEADIYLRTGLTSEWDTAAGHAILKAAGGSMTQIDGSPFVYGKDNILNPPFIASGRKVQ